VSIGTVLEIGFAHAHRKPLVLAIESGNVHEHSMVMEIAGFVVNNLPDAIMVVRDLVSTEVAE
jgi:nucleoside 2-deoxyribosyltransferase